MQINNFEKVKSLCKFGNDVYYKFIAVLCKEDFEDNDYPIHYRVEREHILYTWLVENEDQLDDAIKDMYVYVNFFKCRIYFYIDPKDKKKFLTAIRDKANSYLDIFLNGSKIGQSQLSCKTILKVFNTAQGSISTLNSKSHKHWVFKTKNAEDTWPVIDLENLCGDDFIITLKGVNGYNVIASKTFNPNDRGFKELEKKYNIEIKKHPRIIIAKI